MKYYCLITFSLLILFSGLANSSDRVTKIIPKEVSGQNGVSHPASQSEIIEMPGQSGSIGGSPSYPTGQSNGGSGGNTSENEDESVEFENKQSVAGANVNRVYTQSDGEKTIKYGSFDAEKGLEKFKMFGLSIILLVFSYYLFFVASAVYIKNSNDSEYPWNQLFVIISILIIVLWFVIVFYFKGIPARYFLSELLHYPNQFVFGVLLSSLLVLSIGIFRFSMVAFAKTELKESGDLQTVRFSFGGLLFSLISMIANFASIWSAFG